MSPGTIVFAHANGFPAGTYEPLFERWRQAGWRVEAPERLGHDPRYPVTSNWPRLRDQLVDFVEGRGLRGAVLVGHSLGGVVSLLAACRRPGLASGIVMLDSPVVDGWRAHGVHAAKRLNLIERVGPGKVSRTRRHEWPSREAVHAHFAAKPVFARWDPRMLAAYVRAGFDEAEATADAEGAEKKATAPKGGSTSAIAEAGGGTGSGAAAGRSGRVVLGFRREIETRIYNTLPHHVSTLLRRHPPGCPVGFIAGTRSAEMRQGGFAASRALAGEHWRWIEGTHLYPMERPDETAAIVLELLGAMAADGGRRPRTA